MYLIKLWWIKYCTIWDRYTWLLSVAARRRRDREKGYSHGVYLWGHRNNPRVLGPMGWRWGQRSLKGSLDADWGGFAFIHAGRWWGVQRYRDCQNKKTWEIQSARLQGKVMPAGSANTCHWTVWALMPICFPSCNWGRAGVSKCGNSPNDTGQCGPVQKTKQRYIIMLQGSPNLL